MSKKTKLVLVVGIFCILTVITLYSIIPRFDVDESTKSIENTKKNVKSKKVKNINQDYIAKINVNNKMNDIYVFDNASENTLFNKGAGIEQSISSDFNEKDYTFVKGHVETTFKDLDKLVVGDEIKVTLKNGKILKYEVTNIHEQKHLDNNNIYTYTDKVGLSISTCSKNSINKQFPEKVLVVDAILV